MIVGRDRNSQTTFCHTCLCKGAGDDWIVKKMCEEIDNMGHTEVVIKTDGEPALVAVMEAVRAKRLHPTRLEHPPAYDPQSNGAIEKAVDDAMGQTRAVKIALEQRLKAKVESDWKVLRWAAPHAANLINRCQVGHDGKTPFRGLKGKESQRKLVEFCEQVLAKPKRSPNNHSEAVLEVKVDTLNVGCNG